MGDTQIEWSDKTWNPLRARNILTGDVGWFCEHVSSGCGLPDAGGCYAEKMNVNTYFGNGLPYKASSLSKLEIFLDETMLLQPLHWRAPKKVFVCSMTDLFGRFVKTEWIDKMFAVMALATQHTFQILTKRPDRMHDYMLDLCQSEDASNRVRRAINEIPGRLGDRRGALELPLFNVVLGTSCEDQPTFDERWPFLRDTPAARRSISFEPLLDVIHIPDLQGLLHWAILGGESGSKARRCSLPFAMRPLLKDLRAQQVPCFVKQLGKWPSIHASEASAVKRKGSPGDWFLDLDHPKGGDIEEFPLDLRIREFPA